MMLNKTLIVVCVALFGAILAQEQAVPEPLVDGEQSTLSFYNWTTNNNASNHTHCGEYNVTLVYVRGPGQEQIENITLTRLNCNANGLINFGIPVQNVTILRDSHPNDNTTFSPNTTYGDRFNARQGNLSINITIVPRGTFTLVQEHILGDLIRNMLMIVRNDTNNQTGNNHQVTYLNATVLTSNFSQETVRLYPGWSGALKAQINQTLVAGQHSAYKTQNVTVAPGWYADDGNHSVRATIINANNTQYVTIFFVNHDKPDQKPSEPRYLNATLVPSVNQTFKNENVTLYPGWVGALQVPLNQTLIPGARSDLAIQNVTVVPKWYIFNQNEGVRANVHFPNLTDYISIYFEKGAPKLKSDEPIYLNATIIPQYNQTFKIETAVLYPGWHHVLAQRTNQTLFVGQNSTFVSQNVTVFPGWYLLDGYEGARATVNLTGVMDYVTIFFSNLTFHNLVKAEPKHDSLTQLLFD